MFLGVGYILPDPVKFNPLVQNASSAITLRHTCSGNGDILNSLESVHGFVPPLVIWNVACVHILQESTSKRRLRRIIQ